MKRMILFCSIIPYLCLSQETIDVKFAEVEPIWVHTMVDTTFDEIPSQPYFTKYSSLYPHIIDRKGNSLYILSPCLEKTTLNDRGFVLDKVDLYSGQKLWSHHNTPYNGGDYDFYREIDFSPQNEIKLFGVALNENKKSVPIIKTLDDTGGFLIDKIVSKDTLQEYIPRHYRPFISSNQSSYMVTYLQGRNLGIAGNDLYRYGIELDFFDQNLNRFNKKWDLFDFENLGPFSINQGSLIRRLNESTLLSLAYKDRFESWDNLGTMLMWTDISDPNKIMSSKTIDYSDIIPGSKYSLSLHRMNTLNNTIHISHYYPNFDIQKNTCYILWLDSIGQIKTFIPVPKTNNHIYELTDMIYANQDFAYLYATPSIKNNYGFDIIRIEHGVDSIKYISSLTSEIEGVAFAKNFSIHTLYEDGFLVIGGYTTKDGEGTKTSLKVYCFNASDLGINFEPVSSKDERQASKEYKLFPNPVSHSAQVKLVNIEEAFLELYNLNGQVVLSQKLKNRFNQIHTSSLQNGVYYVVMRAIDGSLIGNTQKLIKVN